MSADTHGARGVAGLRIAVGAIWGIDAYLKWQPAFLHHVVSYFEVAMAGQPAWLMPWFHGWLSLIRMDPGLVAWSTAVMETLLAAALVLGVFRKMAYWLAAVLSGGIWITAEGFGKPFNAGATDIGSSIIYVLLFIALGYLSRYAGTSEPALDHFLVRRYPALDRIVRFDTAGHPTVDPRTREARVRHFPPRCRGAGDRQG